MLPYFGTRYLFITYIGAQLWDNENIKFIYYLHILYIALIIAQMWGLLLDIKNI